VKGASRGNLGHFKYYRVKVLLTGSSILPTGQFGGHINGKVLFKKEFKSAQKAKCTGVELV
jgi:hypothetical protein